MSITPTYNYDKEADVLYISFFPGEKATSAVELNDMMLLRLNYAEKRAIGLTLMDFSVLIQTTNWGPRQFPLSGLHDLELEWQEMVVEILTTPPVNHYLKLSVYTTSSAETIPLALVEHLPQSLAA
jgi:uncharacterized protein YuzE